MRVLAGLFFVLLGCCAFAACSGSVGGGSSALPGGQLPSLQNPTTPAPVVTASPSIASGEIVVNYDGSTQSLPAPGDFKVDAVFPKASASPVTLRVTVSVNGPGDIAPYGDKGVDKKRLFVKHHTQSPAVLYVWFENDKGVAMAAPPSLTFTVPLTALEPYGTDPTVDMALFDPANENKWMLRVASKVESTPTPQPSAGASALASATPTATPTPTSTPTATASAPRPPGAPSVTPTALAPATPRGPVPSTVYRFTTASRSMKLLPKKNFVFVLYAEPAATEAPSPGASGSKGRPSPSASGASSETKGESQSSPAASGSPGSPAPSGSGSSASSSPAAESAAPSPQPSKT